MGAGESGRTSPAVGGTCLTLGGQVDGLAYAVGTAAADQRRQNAAVGGTSTRNFTERNIGRLVRIVSDDKDVVLSSLSGSRNQAVLGMGCGITATDNLIGCQSIGTRRRRVRERSPTTEVDVDTWRAVHVDVDVAWIQDTHIVPGRVRCGVEAVVIRARLAATRIYAGGELIHAVVGTERVGIGTGVVLPRTDVIIHHQRRDKLKRKCSLIFCSYFSGLLLAHAREVAGVLLTEVSKGFR